MWHVCRLLRSGYFAQASAIVQNFPPHTLIGPSAGNQHAKNNTAWIGELCLSTPLKRAFTSNATQRNGPSGCWLTVSRISLRQPSCWTDHCDLACSCTIKGQRFLFVLDERRGLDWAVHAGRDCVICVQTEHSEGCWRGSLGREEAGHDRALPLLTETDRQTDR